MAPGPARGGAARVGGGRSETRSAEPRPLIARGRAGPARRSARDRCPGAPQPEYQRRRTTAPKQGGSAAAREACRCACGCCSIRIRRRPSLDQQMGSATRGARYQTQQSDIVIHAITLLPSRYLLQHERSRMTCSLWVRMATRGRPGGSEGAPESWKRKTPSKQQQSQHIIQ